MSSCTVALNSPVFSPSSSSSSYLCSPSSSVSVHKPRGLIRAIDSGSSAVLKRKRPPRLDIPVVPVGEKAAALVVDRKVVEEEGDGYSVCCKRGRKDVMEDRYSAVVGLQSDLKQVILVNFGDFLMFNLFFVVFDNQGMYIHSFALSVQCS